MEVPYDFCLESCSNVKENAFNLCSTGNDKLAQPFEKTIRFLINVSSLNKVS